MKRGILVVFALIGLICTISFASASLGMTPAKSEFNFESGSKIEIPYRVYADNPYKEIQVYAEGDLSQYVSIDKNKFFGGGSFTVTLNLPASVDKPGKNLLYIAAEEVPDKDSFISTAIKLKSLILVHVPYPGRYIEADLNIPDVNVNEMVPVDLKILSRGTAETSVKPEINFYDSSGKHIDKLTFSPELLRTNDEKHFRKILNSSSYGPDDYLAEAIIDYGGQDIMIINRTFRIGNLKVDVINFTREIDARLSKFIINVKSNWNGEVREVYADVNISNGEEELVFRTPSVDLAAWQQKEIIGYVEADNLAPGTYKAEIRLNYLGQTTYASGDIEIKGDTVRSIWIIVGVISIILLAIIIYLITKKWKKRN